MIDEMLPRIYRKSDGSILMSSAFSCDGFSCDHPYRVQTHIHHDHMINFETSKANQNIYASSETRQLLCAIYNADLPYRSNLIVVEPNTPISLGEHLLELKPSNHMLGSTQVKITCPDGYRIGYSSDFFWPLDEVIEVDELLVDSTYGDPLRCRNYSHQDVDDKLISTALRMIAESPQVAILGHNGRLHYAMYLLQEYIKIPIICSPRAYPLINVYHQNGYPLFRTDIYASDSSEAKSIRQSGVPCIFFATLPERRHLPWLDKFSILTLSAHMYNANNPLNLYDNGDCCLALTDHADFRGTMEYVQASGASVVWTDPRSGNAAALADAINNQLGITAGIVSEIQSRSWG